MLPFHSYSVVIPLYRSEKTIGTVVAEVEDEFRRLGIERYELILVNDCSPDRVLDVVVGLAEKNPRITVVDLARNSGQANASLAGFSIACGEVVVSMDDDMQTPGSEIGRLLEALATRDDDVVFASYDESENHRPLMRSLGTRINWFMSHHILNRPSDIQTNSFFAMKKFVCDCIVSYAGARMYSFAIIFAATSHISNVTVRHRKRAVGVSGYTLFKLVGTLIDGALGYSIKPMEMISVVGAAFIGLFIALSLISLLFDMALLTFGEALLGILCSVALTSLGIVGSFVGRMSIVYSSLPQYTIRRIHQGVSLKSESADSEHAIAEG